MSAPTSSAMSSRQLTRTRWRASGNVPRISCDTMSTCASRFHLRVFALGLGRRRILPAERTGALLRFAETVPQPVAHVAEEIRGSLGIVSCGMCLARIPFEARDLHCLREHGLAERGARERS